MKTAIGMSVRRSWQIIRRMLQITYENLGFVMVLSAVWFMVAWAPLIVVYILPSVRDNLVIQLGALLLSLVGPFGPATAAVVSLTFDLVHQEPVEVRDFFVRARQHLWPSIGLMISHVLVGLVLAVDLWVVFTAASPTVRLFAWVWIYLGVFWVAMWPLQFPLLVRQENATWFTVWKSAALMTMGNIGFALLMLIATALLWMLNVGLVAALILFLSGTTGLLHNLYLSELVRYGRQEAARRRASQATAASAPTLGDDTQSPGDQG